MAEPSAGGLASAVNPILSSARRPVDRLAGPRAAGAGRRARAILLDVARSEHGYVAVDLPPDLARRFYEGYANQTLWPLFHQFADQLRVRSRGLGAYVAANRRFRDAVLEHLEPGDMVWIHDYHLMLLPRLSATWPPRPRVGFFLHIPFPASEMFRILPRRDELLRGLLGADLVAFQTHLDLQHFRSSPAARPRPAAAAWTGSRAGQLDRLEALPIGIAPDEFAGYIESDPRHAGAPSRRCAERSAGRRILLAVDRLDYTKGIPQRLRAFRQLLERAPQLRGKVVLVQVAVPSRETHPASTTSCATR